MRTRDPVALALAASLGASVALLAGAHIFEALGYHPCDLCLDQREAHWTAAAVAAAGLIAARLIRASTAAVAAVGATAFVYALSAGLAFYHTGVEFGYWTASSCGASVPSGVTAEYFRSVLEDGGPEGGCSEAAWRFFGVSMAGYNLLFSAGLCLVCLSAALISTRRLRAPVDEGPRYAG
ncbi:MAG: disulfide bond formation protein B [Pseudomonadota bacterium]